MPYGPDILTGGIATADSEYGLWPASYASDDDLAQFWNSQAGYPHWWKYDVVAVTKIVVKLRVKSYPGFGFNSFKLQGSNNDSDWTEVYSGSAVDTSNWQEFIFSNSTAYRYYKIDMISGYHTEVAIYEVEMMELVPEYPFVLGNEIEFDPSDLPPLVLGTEIEFDPVALDVNVKGLQLELDPSKVPPYVKGIQVNVDSKKIGPQVLGFQVEGTPDPSVHEYEVLLGRNM